MKTSNYLILSTSPLSQPARKPRETVNLTHRQRFLYRGRWRYHTGKERDLETGLYYYGARYLDSKTGRWLSGDPAMGDYVPQTGKKSDNLPGMGGVYNTANLHVYHYSNNNPVKYVDPNGEESLSALFLIEAKKDTIQNVAKKYDIDPVGIGMVLYQENYWGTGTVNLKDKTGLLYYTGTSTVTDETYITFSVGIGQIQLRRAATLLDIDINKSGAKEQIYNTLMNDDMAIDLIGANIKHEEGLLGRKITGEEAGYIHNMGATGYERYLSGDGSIDSNIPKRSTRDIGLIRNAINGVIDIPAYRNIGDDWRDNF